MKHYDYVEWLLYKNNVLSKEKHEEMEEHLYNCNICMEIFLSLIDEREIQLAEEYISEDFAEKTMDIVSKNKVKNLKTKKSFKLQFGYYVAVASVTIVLTLGGFYTNLVDVVPKISASINTERYDEPNVIFNISERIVNKTSNFIVSIEKIDRNREEK